MKKVLLFFVSICLLQVTYAQNYEPYLFGKTYKFLNPTDSTLITRSIDSLYVNTDKDTVFVSDLKASPFFVRTTTPILFFTYIKTNTKYIFDNKLSIKRNPIKDESWLADSTNAIQCQYTGKSIITIYGITDSVKTYKFNKQSQTIAILYISKNYGIVSYGSYNVYRIDNLVGKNNRIPKNYHPSIGDTLLLRAGYTPPCTSTYPCTSKYSIKIIKAEDTISSIVLNRVCNDTYPIEQIKKGVFYKIYSMRDLFSCRYMLRENVGFIYSEILGENNYDSYSEEIVYYKGAAGEFGDRKQMDKILGVENSIETNSSIIYPNPVYNNIAKFSFNDNLSKTISIFDLLGNEIKKVVSNEQNLEIGITKGIYVVKISTENSSSITKLIVY